MAGRPKKVVVSELQTKLDLMQSLATDIGSMRDVVVGDKEYLNSISYVLYILDSVDSPNTVNEVEPKTKTNATKKLLVKLK